MSCIRPIAIPAALASAWAAATCSSAIHCSQRWNSNKLACSRLSASICGVPLPVVSNQRLSPQGAPQTSKATHQVAKASKSSPERALKSAKSCSRSALLGCSKIIFSAGSFALQAALISIGFGSLFCASTDSCRDSTCSLWLSLNCVYSGISCGRI
ncbi:Uncharacterised protein [Chlamydia trachomatis]|nr:Uncharacterised protein [Chlamydia trachomatis]CRH89076.1 Uncharacterised protein [Chlamydia trachomatis]